MPTRRGHGEGSIRKRTDGRWEAQMSLGDGTRKSFYGKTRQEVARQLAAALRDLDKGLPIIRDERQTLATYLASWLDAITLNLDARTMESYRQHVELHIIPTLGAIRISKLTPQQVQDLYAKKIADGLSTTTVRHIHATLHKALGGALRMGIVQRNVSDLVDPPRMRKLDMHVLSRDEARHFLDAAQGHVWEALFTTALFTGMRQGELLALHWRDVDLDAGRLSVRASLQQTKNATGDWVIKAPKTKHSKRQISLSAPVVASLRAHRIKQNALRLKLGEAWEDSDLVFCNSLGTPLFHQNVNGSLKKILQRAGLPAIRFHDLRHTAATLMLKANVNPKIVSEMLGHASIAITLDIYSHVLPDMQQDAAATLAALLA
ncbi:MAG TPA: tyrosine-type recombinase/integrase [Ktedonobacterales bacterium]|nr:tyrosine-type recombinase/integrase [Ktedonobacterales bacterium]